MPWPPGTRILFVGGDQMTTEMSVPIGRFAPVMPGEEVDVAVAMTAPNELGRYLGYWRLAGPHLRRKWGQRVWAHVQVVDPSQPAGAVDIESAVAEFEKLKSKLPADDMQADGGEDDGDSVEDLAEATAMKAANASMAVATAMTSTSTSMASASMASMPIEAAAPPASDKYEEYEEAVPDPMTETVADKVAEAVTDGNLSDDGVLVTDTMVVEAQPEAAPPAAEEALSGVARVKAALKAMGFIDDTMLDAVVAKHGEDLDACATDLTAASEWDSLLEDLAEMGFENRELNKMLMLKNNGNIKRTVKDLVEA
uniref:UBA domain-containing protein n=1 Tax=Haptolina brevifila TaxID=156173 RepID=A0A7S2GC60_9EUKA|mmetsp:Transcript_33264/g.66191  ORF Transcript_33264/g.66191 Transcript_33264/m.66191 type:complete len:311 (+) Transcript_33264:1335-2267(+)